MPSRCDESRCKRTVWSAALMMESIVMMMPQYHDVRTYHGVGLPVVRIFGQLPVEVRTPASRADLTIVSGAASSMDAVLTTTPTKFSSLSLLSLHFSTSSSLSLWSCVLSKISKGSYVEGSGKKMPPPNICGAQKQLLCRLRLLFDVSGCRGGWVTPFDPRSAALHSTSSGSREEEVRNMVYSVSGGSKRLWIWATVASIDFIKGLPEANNAAVFERCSPIMTHIAPLAVAQVFKAQSITASASFSRNAAKSTYAANINSHAGRLMSKTQAFK